MPNMTKPGIIIKIQLLECSKARDFFETKERLFLSTILSKLQKEDKNELNLSEKEKDVLEQIFKKYGKFF